MNRVNHLPRPVVGIGPERQPDVAFVGIRAPFDHRQVGLCDLPAGKQLLQLAVCSCILGKNEYARSVHVEPVDRFQLASVALLEQRLGRHLLDFSGYR